MNLQTLKLKASTLCAGGTLLVLGGFMTVNLAGCGGGGGNGLTTVPTPRPSGVTFTVLQQDGAPSRGSTVTLAGGGKTFTGTAGTDGVVTLPNVPPGTYAVTFTSFDTMGAALPSTTRTLVVTRTGDQSFKLVQGDTGGGPFTVTGRVVLNPDDGDFSTANCDAQSQPVPASVLISVRDLNSVDGTPILAQVVRPLQVADTPANLLGRYAISLPFQPRSFRVEVSTDPSNGAQFAGISATTTFVSTATTIAQVDVCTNLGTRAPAPAVTPTPTHTPRSNRPFQPTPTNTTIGGGGGGGGGQATFTPIPTNTTQPTATPTTGPTLIPGAGGGGTTATTIPGTSATAVTATATPTLVGTGR